MPRPSRNGNTVRQSPSRVSTRVCPWACILRHHPPLSKFKTWRKLNVLGLFSVIDSILASWTGPERSRLHRSCELVQGPISHPAVVNDSNCPLVHSLRCASNPSRRRSPPPGGSAERREATLLAGCFTASRVQAVWLAYASATWVDCEACSGQQVSKHE